MFKDIRGSENLDVQQGSVGAREVTKKMVTTSFERALRIGKQNTGIGVLERLIIRHDRGVLAHKTSAIEPSVQGLCPRL